MQGSSSEDSGSHLLLSSQGITDLKEDERREPEGNEQEKLVKDEGIFLSFLSNAKELTGTEGEISSDFNKIKYTHNLI